MASKNTPQQLLDEGFTPEQFGHDASSWAAYATALLAEQFILVQSRVSASALNAVIGTPEALHVQLAERYLSCAILAARRINKLESALAQSRQSDQMTSLITELRNNQRNYTRMAEESLAAIAATSRSEATSAAPAFGSVNSSHFRNATSMAGGVL